MLQIVTTSEGFDSLEPLWRELGAAGRVRVFQTYPWCRSAWDCYLSRRRGGRLWILAWRREGSDDRVIFPFYIDRSGTLRFLMDLHSDVCDAVYADRRNRFLCYAEVAKAIRGEKAVRRCHFSKLPGGSDMLDGLGVHLPHPVIYKDNAHSCLSLPRTEDAVGAMTHMKTKDRAVLKSFLRKSEAFDFRLRSIRSGDPFPRAEIVEISEEMIRGKRRDADYLSEPMFAFMQAVYEKGICEIATLERGGTVQALSFRLLKGERILSWIVLYRAANVNSLLEARYLQEKARQGAYVFDFGAGVYPYKLGNFRPRTEVTFAFRYDNSLPGFARSLAAMNIRYVKDFLKPLVRKCPDYRL